MMTSRIIREAEKEELIIKSVEEEKSNIKNNDQSNLYFEKIIALNPEN